MSVVRLIYAKVGPDLADAAVEHWKRHCAPLMIRQPGCMSEKLLRSTDNPGEFISYSEWDCEDSIQRYLKSEDHQEIKRHNADLGSAEVTVKHYTVSS